MNLNKITNLAIQRSCIYERGIKRFRESKIDDDDD